jgi:hypothetical protein
VLGSELVTAPPAGARDLEVIQLLGDAIRDTAPDAAETSSRTALMDRVSQLHRDGDLPSSLVSDEDSKLGYLWNRAKGEAPAESLRLALQKWLAEDRSFAIDERDETYREIVRQVGPGIDVVITGHTHLPRWIKDPGLVYLNAGAWARTMGLRPAFLETEAAFGAVYQALRSPDLRTLDETPVLVNGVNVPLVLDATLAAHVATEGRVAELVRITAGGSDLAEAPVDPTQSVLSWQ